VTHELPRRGAPPPFRLLPPGVARAKPALEQARSRAMEGSPMSSEFASIETAIEEIRVGRILVVVDDEDRENEGRSR